MDYKEGGELSPLLETDKEMGGILGSNDSSFGVSEDSDGENYCEILEPPLRHSYPLITIDDSIEGERNCLPALSSNEFQYRAVPCYDVPSTSKDYSSSFYGFDVPFLEKCKQPNNIRKDMSRLQIENGKMRDDQGVPTGAAKLYLHPEVWRKRSTMMAPVMQEQLAKHKRRMDNGMATHVKKLKRRDNYYDEESVEIKTKRAYSYPAHAKMKSHIPKQTIAPVKLKTLELDENLSDQEYGHAIAKALFEEEHELIIRVIETGGRKFAMDLYKATKVIEENGGVMIKNGTRRKTSGGVYLQLFYKEHFLEEIENSRDGNYDHSGSSDLRLRKYKAFLYTRFMEDESEKVSDGFSDNSQGTKCSTSTGPVTTLHHSIDGEQILPTMDILEYYHLPVLPPEILDKIFLHLPSHEIMLNVALVSKGFYHVVNQTRFWFQRLKYLGFSLCRDVRRELLNFGDDNELQRCLQATCYHIEASQKKNAKLIFGNSPTLIGECTRYTRCEARVCQGRRSCNQEPCVAERCSGRGGCLPPPSVQFQHHHHMQRYRQKRYPRPIVHANVPKDIARDMEEDGKWRITEDKLRVATIMLRFRKPQLVEIELYSNTSCIKQLWLFVVQLTKVDCEVHVKDFGSWRRPRKSTTDKLLHRLTQLHARCQVTLFRGSVQNMDNLPVSIINLSVAIGSDIQAESCAQGFAEITRRLPYLDELRVHIFPGVNVQCLPPLPSGRCQSSLFLSDVGSPHLLWAASAARKLRPRGRDGQYRYLVFPASQLLRETSQMLLTNLEENHQVQFWELVIASPYIEQRAEAKLVNTTRKLWPNCRGFTWVKLDEYLALAHYRW